VYKAKDKTDINNYRPIRLLPIISKVFEILMFRRLTKIFNHHYILDTSQHGFRPGRSTVTAAVELIDTIYQSLDKGECTIGLFMDLSKVFDLVDYDILLNKIPNIGVRGIANIWFKSYLEGRKQVVYVNFANVLGVSSPLDINLGVPQGSILLPLLYIIHVNDFARNFILYKVVCYADDTSLLLRSIFQKI
jgi:hypothetical protein